YGWNFVGNDNDPNPTYTNIWRNNHGTFIAGVIAAKNDDIGIVGAAPNIKIMNLKIFYYYGPDDDEDEWVTRDELGLAIDYAVANGADIISCSFSYKKEVFENVKDVAFYDEMEAAIEQGVVIVASAGNYDSSTKRMPACFEFVIGVGATDINNNLASYSSYGDWVDLVAPGGDTDGNEVHKINSTYFDGSYTTGYGTSYSAPIVAGVIALMKSVDNSLNPNILRKILQQTCVDLGDKGKDKYFGYGLIDAAAAVTMAQNASTMNFVSGFTFILSSSSAIAVSVVILIWKRKCKLVN
ncbi:MAG: S8 family serine peptidase, partial [Asgard group archaeon]|nr:S8 family serine peptidase [Asgard group archaeon]